MSVIDHRDTPQLVAAPSVMAVLRRKLAGGRNAWALGDQVLISGSNFITMVLVARGLSMQAFGDFSLVYVGLMFANLLQTALITQPHNVLGAARLHHERHSYPSYTLSTMVGQVGLAGVEMLGAAYLAIAAYARHWHTAPLLLALIPSIAAWQFQEFFRRVMYSEGRTGAALFNDIISYGGQMAAVAALWWFDRLTAASAMYAIAATSGLAAIVGLVQVGRSLAGVLRRDVFVQNWQFGRWLLGAEVLNWCSSISAIMYVAGAMLGPAATGELRAVQVLFGPARVISFFLCTVLPIQFVHAFTAGGDSALHAQVRSIARLIVPVMALYCVIAAVFARPLLVLTFKHEYAAGATALMLYSAVAFLSYLQMLVTAALTARGLTRAVFAGSVCGACATALLAWVLIRAFALPGALAGMIVSQGVVTVILWNAYRRGIVHRRAVRSNDATCDEYSNDQVVAAA